MLWKKHKKKVLWCLVALLFALALSRATFLSEIIFARRVWFGETDDGHVVVGWRHEQRWPGCPPGFVRTYVDWYEETGWLRLREEIDLSPEGELVGTEELLYRSTSWSYRGDVIEQRWYFVFENGDIRIPLRQKIIGKPPWRWGAKPRTPATGWMKARWIP